MKLVPLWGRGFKGKSSNVTAQRRLNLYAEVPPETDKSQFVLYGRPGLNPVTMTTTAGGRAAGPTTGAITITSITNGGTVYSPTEYAWLVRGCFEQLSSGMTVRNSNYTPFSAAEFDPGSALCALAYNGTCIFAVNGASAWWLNGYAVTAAGIVEASAGAPGAFPWTGATSVTFLAGRFIVNYPKIPGQFCWSILNSFVASNWSGLDFATAESSPDGLVCVLANRGELVLFGTQTTEFWIPDATTVFAAIVGATVQWGLVAQWSVQVIDGSVFFLGVEADSRPKICVLVGHVVTPISTPDVEAVLNRDDIDLSLCTSTAFNVAGHLFYVLNLANTSLVFDSTSKTWGEWQTDGSRWACNFVLLYSGTLIGMDSRNGNVYIIDPDTFADNGQPIIHELISRHIFNNLDRISVAAFAVDIESGVGVSTGQGSDPQMSLQISRDGGHTYGNEMWTTLGAVGQYLQRAVWRRLGRGRDFVFKLRISDPIKVVIVAASLLMS